MKILQVEGTVQMRRKMKDTDFIQGVTKTERYIVCTKDSQEVICSEEDCWNAFVSSGYDLRVLENYTTIKEVFE